MTEESIKIGGLKIPIKQTARGPKIAKSDPTLEPFAWFVNLALDGHLPDLASLLSSGADVHFKQYHAVAEGDGHYRVSVDFVATTIIVPARTILEAVETLSARKKVVQPRVSKPPAEIPARPPPEPLVRPPLPSSFHELERNAVELDLLELRERTPQRVAEAARKRRILVHDMSDLGIFERVPIALPEDTPTLHAYQAASQRLGKYLESPERAKYNPDARPTRMVNAPVSLDWFRIPSSPGPSHLPALEWLAYLEWILTLSERIGDSGEIVVPIGDDDWWVLRWRADDGEHPAVVAATRGERS